MTDHHHGHVFKPRQAPHHGMIIGKIPIASQGRKLAEQGVDVIFAMGPLRMAGHLTFAPGCQAFI